MAGQPCVNPELGPRRRPGRRFLAPEEIATVCSEVADSALPFGIGIPGEGLRQRFTLIDVTTDPVKLGEGGAKILLRVQDTQDNNKEVAWLESRVGVDDLSWDIVMNWRQEALKMLMFGESVIQLLKSTEVPEGKPVRPVMIQEWATFGNLYDHVNNEQLTAMERVDYLRQTIEALKVVHDKMFMHGDIKPWNYLVVLRGESRKVVLTDFATSHQPSPKRNFRSPFGTRGFEAPERCCAVAEEDVGGMPYTNTADLYSLGPLALHLVYDKLPWDQFDSTVVSDDIYLEILKEMDAAAIPFILKEELGLQTDELKGFAGVITNLMHFAPPCRYTCVQLLGHPLLRSTGKIRVHDFQSGDFAKWNDPSKTISLVIAIHADAGGFILQPTTFNIPMDSSDFSDILKAITASLRDELVGIFKSAQNTAKVDRDHINYRRSVEFDPFIKAQEARIHALARKKFKVQNVEAFGRNEKVFADWDLIVDGDGFYIRLNEERVKQRIELEELGLLWPRTFYRNLPEDAE